jgi:membrane-bound acyltransferase YfiQ involved in biofilm formation
MNCQQKFLQNILYCKIVDKFIKFILQFYIYCDSKPSRYEA